MLNRHKSGLLIFLILVCALARPLFDIPKVSANIMYNRSVVISSAQPSAVTTEAFEFDIPSTSVLGSIVLEYCSNSPSFYSSCAVPAGLDVSAANLTSQFGNTGFSIDTADSTPNKLVLTRAAIPGTIVHSGYTFSNITNPSSASPSIFVKMSTYSSTDGSGAYHDTGAVAFAIQNAFNVYTYVPPFLQLCVGITVAPDCSSASGDSIDLGILSYKHANYAQSQFATATNDITGYNIFALGPTMTAGTDIIPSLNSPTASFPGTGQFGINLRANLIPPIGQDPVGLGTAVPTANYDQPNRYTYIPGDNIVQSATTTNYNRMTVSYVVNVPSNQPAGVYATTLTYLAVTSF